MFYINKYSNILTYRVQQRIAFMNGLNDMTQIHHNIKLCLMKVMKFAH